jgi:PAS domain S-box-containing protein
MTQPRKRPPTARRTKPRSTTSREVPLQDAARYREFFENANDALALFNPDGSIALINRAAERLLGYARAELLGQHYRKVVTKATAALGAERSRKARANTPLASTFEAELVRKDGSIVVVEARDRLLRDAAGTILGFQGIYRDITERRAAEQRLRDSEARYRTIFAVSPDLMYLTDVTGRLLDANPALLQRTGLTLAQLQQHHVLDFFAGEHPEGVHDALALLQQGHAVEGFEVDARTADGTIATYEINALPLREGETITQVLSLARDITTRKRNEAALRQSEERYRLVSHSISDYAFSFRVTKGEFVLEWLTDSFTTITGYAVADVLAADHPLAVYMHPEDIPRITALVQSLPPAQPTTYEFRIRTKGGAERWIQSTAQAVQDPGGQFVRLYGAARDITEQKQREADIVESRRLRDRIAETMPDIVYTYDLDQRAFVYVNRQLFTILGYQPEQVLHRTDVLFRDRLHGADIDKVKERDARLATAADGDVITMEIRLKHATGEWRSLRVRETVALRSAEGAPRQIVGTAQDITERKWLEDLLHERVLDRTELPARLKAFRTGLRLSQAQFGAQFGGYSQPQLSAYESGESLIPLGLLLAIREKGYPVEAVLGGRDRDVISKTATFLPAHQPRKLLALDLLHAAVHLLTRESHAAEEVLQGLGIEATTLSGESYTALTEALRALLTRE